MTSPSAADRSHAPALSPGSNGIWCSTTDPVVLAALGRSSADWIALDAQHGPHTRATLAEAGRELARAGRPFAVRVGAVDAAAIGYALDIGASTVIVPQVETAAQAELVVRAAHYPPRGERSWGPLAPLWGAAPPDPTSARPQVAVMIETARGLDAVEAIASVPGVDLLFVGPFDLALSLGRDVDELLRDADGPLERIRHAGVAAGVMLGGFAGTGERAEHLRARGFDCVAVATDLGVIAAGVNTILGGD
ncbi:HpcH/HpaI aldolase/citrate lyase family protein [Curtobacterium sp. ISL-83]|uniref:HpcH/HpaI aldolase family protein n=1 Tax=Curtobacterium sp. ISL-83 TaxID=2819145 RepID=UPI001BEBD669|nr:aldolase/citrate lyase family protein [Curtobacterium sp. ISL-83]MBT2503674.1 hypothetical protein [Curtobacterium sp. ISL-83]